MRRRTAALTAALCCGVALASRADEPCETAPALKSKAASAQALATSGKFAEARDSAQQVLAACPTQPAAVAALGEALFGEEKYDDAIAQMSAAIKAEPKLAHAYYWRGKAYNAKKQAARMVDDFQVFLKLAPDAPEAPAIRQMLAALK